MKSGTAWSIAGLTVGIGTSLVMLLISGGGPPPPLPGLQSAGAFTGWALPAVRFVTLACAVATIGFCLAAAILLPATDKLEGLSVQAVRWASRWAWGWLAASAFLLALNVSDLNSYPLTNVELRQVLYFVDGFATGRALVIQMIAALVVALLCRWSLAPRVIAGALGVALLGLLPGALSGHAAAAGSHTMATVSLLMHLWGAAIWVGGLVALTWVGLKGSKRLPEALARYSTLATWSFVIVAASGLISGVIRIGSLADLGSAYGLMLIAKFTALVVLGFIGWYQRTRIVAAGDGRFVPVALWETFIMVATMGLASVLARTATPLGENVLVTPQEIILGGPVPEAPTFAKVMWGFEPDGFGLAVVTLGTSLYVAGVIVLHRRGDRWPIGRTISFLFGLLVVAWATIGGLGDYSHVAFSLHMISHMMLSMVAPIFLVLGAPLTLALRALPGPRRPGENSPRSLLNDVLHSRVSKFYTHPLTAAVIFVGSLYVLYFTNLFELGMRTHSGHLLMEFHFLVAGFLFYYVIIGVDPSPRNIPPLGRFGVLMVTIPFHTFFSVILMISSVIIAEDFYRFLDVPWVKDLAHDQFVGGGIAWAMGEVPLLIVMIAIFAQWFRSDRRESIRRDRAADRDDDAELEAYNAKLASLAQEERRHP